MPTQEREPSYVSVLDEAKAVVPDAVPRTGRDEPLGTRQRVPPVRHLRKARARLDRLEAVGIDLGALAAGKKHVPPTEQRAAYVRELELVLRDYKAMLEGLMPDWHE